MASKAPRLRVLAEGVAIVFSILLAFGIQAWWEQRQDRADAVASLELLSRDLSETVDQLGEFERLTDQTSTAALEAYVAMTGPAEELDPQAVSDAIVRASGRRTVRIPSAAYTDLLSTGGLRLIEDRELRDQIVRFYESAQRSQDIISSNNASFIDGLLMENVLGAGLVMSRPTDVQDIGVMSETTRRLVAGLGEDFDHHADPLWALPDSAEEWNRVRGTMLQVAKATISSGLQATALIESASALRAAIETALGR